MNPSLKRQLLKTFVQMIGDLKGTNEIETFLKDFFDEKELERYVKRMSIAYWLKKGRNKENIERNLQGTEKEIVLARESLKTRGIKLALKKIEAEEWANIWSEKIKNLTKTNK